jgi:putative oxidoreductase
LGDIAYPPRVSTHDDEFQNFRQYDDSGYSTKTVRSSAFSDFDDEDTTTEDRTESTRWHGGLDFGLLVLRLGLGGTMGAHGLQKVFGLFGGPGIDGFTKTLAAYGFHDQLTVLSWVTGISELAGGALLVLGLFTPLGAAAVLGVTANIVYAKIHGGFFIGQQGKGFEYELFLAVAAFSLLFTGPGRVAIDVHTPWRRKPVPFGIAGLILAGAATAAVLYTFR